MDTHSAIGAGGGHEAFVPTFHDLLACEEPGVLREPLRRWMASGRDRFLEAGVVFEVWLRCGGEPSLIRASLLRWVGLHGSCPSAQFRLQSVAVRRR